MKETLNVGMIGFGNIGAGVLRSLDKNRALIDSRLPCAIRVARICDIDVTTKRNAPYDPAILSSDTDAMLADPAIDVVLELTGKIEFARQAILKALRAGKHVVTANKALLALHGGELMREAVDHEVCLLFEAAVGGGIPLIRTLHQGLAANDIRAVSGIINGTANYILTNMTEKGLDFGVALKQAQELGYAEPDPTFDIEGHDTAHKLAVLATLCFDQDVHFDDVSREGITRVTALDIGFARQMGYTIKLLGLAKRAEDGSIEVRVHPTLLPADSRLASIGGVFNAVQIDGDLTGSVLLSGRGAGPDPTSSAVLSDLMALASGKDEGGLRREMRLCLPGSAKHIRPMNELVTRYCVRLAMNDVAGALAQALTILGKHGVSIESMQQQPHNPGEDFAHVIVMTHEAREEQVQSALAEVRALAANRAEPFVLRIEDLG
jgi:homoserine dehydrogenase